MDFYKRYCCTIQKQRFYQKFIGITFNFCWISFHKIHIRVSTTFYGHVHCAFEVLDITRLLCYTIHIALKFEHSDWHCFFIAKCLSTNFTFNFSTYHVRFHSVFLVNYKNNSHNLYEWFLIFSWTIFMWAKRFPQIPNIFWQIMWDFNFWGVLALRVWRRLGWFSNWTPNN